MATEPLATELGKLCPWLFDELGFRLTEESFDDALFGDSLVVLTSASMRVRFIRDRDQVYCEIAGKNDWMDLSQALAAKGREGPNTPDLDTVTRCFRENHELLLKGLGGPA